ncbi:MAG: WD40/YVTN/BNR-like repeat-containing protein, partial [Longimicrobiales bacterium]
IVPENVPSYAPPPEEPDSGDDRDGRRGRDRDEPTGPLQESMPSCESGYTYPEPNNHRFVWGTCYAAHVATFDELSGLRRSVSPWMHTLDSDPVGLKYRCQWSPPLAIDWFDNSVYFGCQVVFRTRDRGQTWEVISPDLSTADPDLIVFSGGVTGDNLGQFYGAVISAIAPSRTQQGVVWVGTNDGKVWISRDAGENWIDLTENVDMPPLGLVRRIDASHFDPATAYMAVDYHLVDNRDPYLYKTDDFGQTWTRIDGGLPRGHPLDYTLAIAENPNRRGMIFAGTGHAFFYSLDDGASWTQFKDRLPAAPVNWIEVPENAPEVVIATYGRGIWILRDLWQLEQQDLMDAEAELQLYEPRPATRTGSGGTADFVFALRSVPTSLITVEILDAAGAVINSKQVQGLAGMNRTSWNLRYPPPDQPVLRSIPPDNPHIWEAGRWEGRERPVTHWGLGAARWEPRAAPGSYSVRLTYDGELYTQPFEVVRDVTLPSTDADLIAGTKMQRDVVAAINEVVDRIDRIEIMRAQVEDMRAQHAGDGALDESLAAIYQRMYETELHFLSRTVMHSDDKWYVEKDRLYLNLVWLLAEIGGSGGDVAGGAGYRPTDAAIAVFQDRLKELETANADFDALMREVEAFNRANAGRLAPISDTLAGRISMR